MKTITVRDLRQRWPQASAVRKRFDPVRHAGWQARANGRRVVRWVDEFLAADREAREAGGPRDLHRQ